MKTDEGGLCKYRHLTSEKEVSRPGGRRGLYYRRKEGDREGNVINWEENLRR